MFVTTRVTFRDAPSNLVMSCAEAGLVLVAFDRATLPWHAGQVLRVGGSHGGLIALTDPHRGWGWSSCDGTPMEPRRLSWWDLNSRPCEPALVHVGMPGDF